MDARIDELERLAALHRSGVLTDEEFAAQKARTLSGAPAAVAAPAAAAPRSDAAAAATPPPQLSATWQRRFAFFAEHGSPLSGPRRAGASAAALLDCDMDTRERLGFPVRTDLLLRSRLVEAGAALAALALISAYVGAHLFGDGVGRVIGIVSSVLCSMTVNYARYIKVTEGRDEWNPFADMFSKRAPAPGV